jgi:glycosyltransferase involved in cell wall biosynthesis
MPHLSRTIAVTRQVADFHKQSLGNSIEVIENGVAIGALPDAQARTAARSRLGVPDGAFVVGCVARLAQEKRHDRLLEAFKRMRTPAHLVLIGDGPSRASLETLAAALGLASRVHFLGTQLNPEALLPGLDVITLTSDREGLPMSLLEGMAAAIPVVATAVGGIPALLANDAGIAIAPDDSDLFAASLDALAADPARRETLGARGRARAIAHHSLEAMSAAYVSVYREELKRCA